MNLVDPVLRTSNSGAVLAAVNCFLVLTKDMPDMRYQVLCCTVPYCTVPMNSETSKFFMGFVSLHVNHVAHCRCKHLVFSKSLCFTAGVYW